MNTLLAPHGLTLGQFSILHHVARQKLEGANRISDIAAAVEVGQPAVTKTVHKFNAMGLVELVDDPQDKRTTRVVAKPQASALLDQIHQSIGPDLARCFAALGEEDAERLAGLLERLGKWLDQNRLP